MKRPCRGLGFYPLIFWISSLIRSPRTAVIISRASVEIGMIKRNYVTFPSHKYFLSGGNIRMLNKTTGGGRKILMSLARSRQKKCFPHASSLSASVTKVSFFFSAAIKSLPHHHPRPASAAAPNPMTSEKARASTPACPSNREEQDQEREEQEGLPPEVSWGFRPQGPSFQGLPSKGVSRMLPTMGRCSA